MKPLFAIEDETMLLTAARASSKGKRTLHFFAQGEFDHDATGIEFHLSHVEAYQMAVGLAQTLETDNDEDDVIILRLNDAMADGESDLPLSPAMAAQLSRQLLLKLSD